LKHCNPQKNQVSVQCFRNVDEIPESWDVLIPPHHFLSRTNIVINEKARLADISYRYVLLTKNNIPVAAAHFQVLTIQREHLNESALKPMQKTGWRIFSALFHPKLLVAGHLFRHDISSFYCSGKIDAFESFRLYQQAIDIVLKETCASAILVKDVPVHLVTYFQHYAPLYLTLRNDISMELNINESWHVIADYEKALKHKYAQRYRKIRGLWGTVEVRELTTEEAYDNKQRIFELYRQVCEKQPARIGILNAEYIPILKAHYPESLRIWGIFKEAKMIGFYSAWVKEDVFDMFYIGFDYIYNAELQLYFNILYCTIEEAIKLNKKKLILGRTALDAKARLGCKPRYLSTFLFIRNRFLRMAIQQLQANAQSQEGAWEERHPLK